ncbi:MAG: N-acetylmuramoyl-L-alanine amidase [Erysipelotrichaceae bacterium]|nr:N-acetylmuramoyl-L-alanine amidase [Erysipelotrichaceae bacterium]
MTIRIFIDPGHNLGTINAGASANGLVEADVNFQVGKGLADILRMDDRFEVRMSRNTIDEVIGTDMATSLQTRVTLANDWPADYFISIHCNYSEDVNLNGSEVYIYRRYTQANWLAEHLLQALVDVVQMRDNLIHVDPELYVLKHTTMPANLVELGYLTNINDAEKLRNDKELFSVALYVGLLQYFGFAA